jgi:type II secretory pathway component PulM
MSITGQNAVVNQFTPKFVFNSLINGQTVIWNSNIHAFVNGSASANLIDLTALQAKVAAMQVQIAAMQITINYLSAHMTALESAGLLTI